MTTATPTTPSEVPMVRKAATQAVARYILFWQGQKKGHPSAQKGDPSAMRLGEMWLTYQTQDLHAWLWSCGYYDLAALLMESIRA